MIFKKKSSWWTSLQGDRVNLQMYFGPIGIFISGIYFLHYFVSFFLFLTLPLTALPTLIILRGGGGGARFQGRSHLKPYIAI